MIYLKHSQIDDFLLSSRLDYARSLNSRVKLRWSSLVEISLSRTIEKTSAGDRITIERLIWFVDEKSRFLIYRSDLVNLLQTSIWQSSFSFFHLARKYASSPWADETNFFVRSLISTCFHQLMSNRFINYIINYIVHESCADVAKSAHHEVDLHSLLSTFIDFSVELDVSDLVYVQLDLIFFTREDCRFTYHWYNIDAILRKKLFCKMTSEVKLKVIRLAQRMYESINFRFEKYFFVFCADEWVTDNS